MRITGPPRRLGIQYQQSPVVCAGAGRRNAAVIDRQLNILEKKYNTTNPTSTRTHYLRPLSVAHLTSVSATTVTMSPPGGSIYAPDLRGLPVILMACINFVNLDRPGTHP